MRGRSRGRWRQWLAWLLFAGVVSICIYGFVIEPARLVERRYALALPHWPVACDGLRVDVVTDVHTGSPRNGVDKLDRMVGRLLASDAQVVLMAGDYVILSVLAGTYVPAEVIAKQLRPLTARKQVYAVLGNHDWWKNGPRVSRAFSAAGVQMIDNRALPVQVGGCGFWLAGLGDLLEGKPDVAGTYAGIPAEAAVLALTHEPALFRDIPARTALTVAGHTHGGQINPLSNWFPTREFKPRSHWLRGEIRADGRVLFVSPGIGTSILPMRLGVPPEISQLTLRRAAVGASAMQAPARR